MSTVFDLWKTKGEQQCIFDFFKLFYLGGSMITWGLRGTRGRVTPRQIEHCMSIFTISITDALFQPSIATVHPGESPVFSCFSQTADIDFQFKAVGSPDSILIYSTIRRIVDSKYADDYTVTASSGNYDLTVLNASSADAGRYTCESDSGSETAELVVIGISAEIA